MEAFVSTVRRSGAGRAPRLLAVLAIAGLLCGCGCGSREPQSVAREAEEPVRGGTIRVLHERAGTLDPIYIDDVYESVVANQIYEGLVRVEQDLSPAPALAESWVVEDDGCFYRFHLRPGVRFHDGRPLTASTVVASIHRALAPDRKGPCLAEIYLLRIVGAPDYRAGHADSIRGLAVENDRTLTIRLSEPLSFFLSVLCMDQLRVVPDLAPGEDPDRAPVGTGPFRLHRRDPDGFMEIVRHDAYWGAKSYIDTVRFIPETSFSPQESVSRLIRGEAEVVAISGAHRELVEQVAGYKILRSPEISVTFLGIHTATPPLDRPEVRRALAMAIDRRGLIPTDATDLDLASGILPPGLGGYQPEPKVLPYDPAAARAELAKAGYGPHNPLPVLDLYTNKSSTRWLEDALTRQFAEIGVQLRYHSLSWPELDARIVSGRAGLFTLSWVADVPDPDSFLSFLFGTDEPNNMFGFSDGAVDSLLSIGRRMHPGAERFAIYRDAEARVLAQAPIVPLFHGATLYAWDPRVQGVELSAFGFATTPFNRVWLRPRAPQGYASGEVGR